MASSDGTLLFLGLIAVVGVGAFAYGRGRESGQRARDDKHNKELRKLLEEREASLEKAEAKVNAIRNHVEEMHSHFKKSFYGGLSWMASFIGEADKALDEMISADLAFRKRPALKASAEVAAAKSERREIKKQLKLLQYELQMYKDRLKLPEAEHMEIADDFERLRREVEDSDVDDLSIRYLSKDEYKTLPTIEKNQLALNRYLSGSLSKSEVGRLYERFVGIIYEHAGFHVEYYGIKRGLEDRGIDLICKKGKEVHLVQLKCWSLEKLIHEKHVFQLYGSTHWYIDKEKDHLGGKNVKPVIVTTTFLSDFAKDVAKLLGIDFKCGFSLDKEIGFIKCNISKSTKEKIYHLPFDQKYDDVKIDFNSGEFYAVTVQEAERSGFRRAMKHFYLSSSRFTG